MFVTDRLDDYKSADGKYNGLFRILGDPAFLQYCYMLIKGEGNMSKGIQEIQAASETLYGIRSQWFVNVAKDIKTGKFNFTPARREMIVEEFLGPPSKGQNNFLVPKKKSDS
jgi:hypothetical protein